MSALDFGQGQVDPQQLAQLLGAGAQQQPGPPMVADPGQQQPEPQADPLQALQDAIHSVTAAMVALPDPQDTQDVAAALVGLARVQTRLMRQAPGGAPQG